MATTIHTLSYKITADTIGVTRGLGATKKEIAEAKNVMRSTRTPMEQYQARVAKLDTLLKKDTITLQQYNRALKQAKVEMTGTAKATGGMTAALGKLGAGFAAATALRSLVRSNLDFQSAMAKSTAIMGDLNEDIRREMKKTAQVVARETKFSATEAAEAYFFLSSAGLSAKQSIAALPAVARFAQAGMFDLSEATSLLAGSQSALGLKMEDPIANLKNMVLVSDTLVKANTLADATVQEFSEALTNKAGASLRFYNKGIAEGVAVLAAFADQQIEGQKAGTALSIILRELGNKALTNKEAFDEFNISIFEAGEMRNLADIIGNFETALGSLTPELQTATLMQLGLGSESAEFLKILLGNSDAIRGYEDALKSVNGLTKEVSDKTIPDSVMAMNRMKAAWDEVASSFVVTEGIKNVSKSLENIADIFNSFSAEGDVGDKVTAFFGSYGKFLTDLIDKVTGAQAFRSVTGGREESELERMRQRAGAEFAGGHIAKGSKVHNAPTAAELTAGKPRSLTAQSVTVEGEKVEVDPHDLVQKRRAEMIELQKSIDAGRAESERQAAAIVGALGRVENATKESGVTIENPPGSR